MDDQSDQVAFFCDAMLGGLARWLRACGYDAAYEYGIDDGDLVARAGQQGRIILSSDGPLFERNAITSGGVAAEFVPRQLTKFEQLEHVVRRFGLKRRSGRCMDCGGPLREVPKHRAADEAPPLAFRRCQHFWRCDSCGKLFWSGTHWQRIEAKMREIFGPNAAPR